MSDKQPFKCGHIAIVGRPNVGKSTLMNHILGQKLSITSRKPQTTRHRILGIKSEETYQAIYVDTPGLHSHEGKAMNRYLNRAAASSLADVNLILMVVDVRQWTTEDDNVLKRVMKEEAPVILVINKIDLLDDREKLLPVLAKYGDKHAFTELLPLSALKQDNLKHLQKQVVNYLPEGEAIYPEDELTDRSGRFLASEIIREKLTRMLGQELPYAITVEIEQFQEDGKLLRIAGLIWVERETQKHIVIGKGGQRLKDVGREARIDIEELFGQKVFLKLWVKVKEGWSDNERLLGSLGYELDQ